MANDLQLLSVGDASIDSFLTPTESETMCKVDSKDCLICFSYGDKIPVKSLELSAGGNAANNAVGATRLGIKTAIVLTLGDDAIGEQITSTLKKENVDQTYVFTQQATRSNYSTVINYSGERTIFVYHAPRSYEFPVQLPKVPWMYLTSMGESFKPFYNHIADWLQKNPQTKLAFNPGSWQFRVPVADIKNILSLTYIIFVNKEEAEKLTGITPTTDGEKDLLQAVAQLGPKIVVITDGENGSYAYDSSPTAERKNKFIKVGVLPVDAYERTGAGDAFGCACLAALIKGNFLEESLVWGLVNSASVIGYTGPQKGLLKEDDMPIWLDRAKSSGVKVAEF